MRWLHTLRRRSLATLGLAVVLGSSSLLTVAKPLTQDNVGPPNAPSPAQGHVAVIAHGVEQFPARDVAWQLTTERASLPARSTTVSRPPGFVLADTGVVAVVGRDGLVLARVAPGEADWISPGLPTAIVSFEPRATTYVEIALLPAADVSAAEAVLTSHVFTLPRNAAFDVVLVRDALNRNDESEIDTGDVPGLLLVTSGTVTVEHGNGETVDLEAGDAAELDGEAVVVGTSRTLAIFVVAQLGPQVPDPVTLRGAGQPTAAPIATATPTRGASPTPTLVVTNTPVATAPVTATATLSPTATSTPPPPLIPTATPTGTPTQTPPPSPTATPAPVPPSTPPPTSTPVPTATPAPTATPIPTATPTVIPSPTPTLIPTATPMPIPTATSVPIPTATPTSTPTQTPVPIPTATPTPPPPDEGSISIFIRACPPGMTVETLVGDACSPPPPGVTLALVADGTPLEVASAADDLWLWDRMPQGDFDLFVQTVPEGVESFSLGVRACCNARGAFDVATSAETPDTGYTLYLYQ